jgi:hypothetical protein
VSPALDVFCPAPSVAIAPYADSDVFGVPPGFDPHAAANATSVTDNMARNVIVSIGVRLG